MSKQSAALRSLLKENSFLMLPGVYDCLGARVAEQSGFPALYFSGGAFSMAQLGRPDMGFFGLGDLTGALMRLLSCVSVPVITDADNAFGNAVHAANTAKTLCALGIAGMQLDDDILPQRYPGRSKDAIEWELLTPKIRAIRSAADSDFVLILRCMLARTEGIEKAIERANMAAELGVDYVYFDGISSDRDLELIAERCRAGRMVNLNEMTYPAKLPLDTLKGYGFTVGLYPVSAIQAAAKAYETLFTALRQKGSTLGEQERMTPSTDILNLMGMQSMIDAFSPLYKIKS